MTYLFLKYIVAVAETGSITEAARKLHISQPSLSAAVKEVEKKIGFRIFTRSRSGIALTKEGVEFLGYARQVIQEMDLLEDRYISNKPKKQRFCVSTQHYTFTANAFVEMIQKYGKERYEFILNETQTHQILKDVKNRFSDLGIIYLCDENEQFLRKTLDEMDLKFRELFIARPHVFLSKDYPLANKKFISFGDLEEYPRLNFLQGSYESSDFSEEPFSKVISEKTIRISDRAAVVNLMLGLNAYTISSGIYPKYLQGESIVAVPLDDKEVIRIGYVISKDQNLSELAKIYIEALKKYNPNNS